jgi:hypothetical protein
MGQRTLFLYWLLIAQVGLLLHGFDLLLQIGLLALARSRNLWSEIQADFPQVNDIRIRLSHRAV